MFSIDCAFCVAHGYLQQELGRDQKEKKGISHASGRRKVECRNPYSGKGPPVLEFMLQKPAWRRDVSMRDLNCRYEMKQEA